MAEVAGRDTSRSSFVRNVSEPEVVEGSSAILLRQQQNAHRCRTSSILVFVAFVMGIPGIENDLSFSIDGKVV
jgi:hypothetical protein